MTEIKFCENNFTFGTEETMETLKKHANAEVSVEPCLGYCGDCATGPYALVNDELVQGDTADELLEKIEAMLS